MLVDFKSWGGTYATVDKLQLALKQAPDLSEEIVKTEMAFYSHTQKADKIEQPEPF